MTYNQEEKPARRYATYLILRFLYILLAAFLIFTSFVLIWETAVEKPAWEAAPLVMDKGE